MGYFLILGILNEEVGVITFNIGQKKHTRNNNIRLESKGNRLLKVTIRSQSKGNIINQSWVARQQW